MGTKGQRTRATPGRETGASERQRKREAFSRFDGTCTVYTVHSVQSGENQSGPASGTEQERKAKGNIPKVVDKFAYSGQQAK